MSLHLLISSPIAFDQVNPEKGIPDVQYFCFMAATVNSSGTLMQEIAANPSGKWSPWAWLLAFSLIIESASFDNFTLFVTYVCVAPRPTEQRLHGNVSLWASGLRETAEGFIRQQNRLRPVCLSSCYSSTCGRSNVSHTDPDGFSLHVTPRIRHVGWVISEVCWHSNLVAMSGGSTQQNDWEKLIFICVLIKQACGLS